VSKPPLNSELSEEGRNRRREKGSLFSSFNLQSTRRKIKDDEDDIIWLE
jgi:hypothetical protein